MGASQLPGQLPAPDSAIRRAATPFAKVREWALSTMTPSALNTHQLPSLSPVPKCLRIAHPFHGFRYSLTDRWPLAEALQRFLVDYAARRDLREN